MSNNTNAIVPFATGTGANVEAAAAWANETVRQLGFQSGIASSQQINTAIRQASVVATAVAQFIADFGTSNVNDDGNVANLEQQFITALSLLVSSTLPTEIIFSGTDGGTANAVVATTTPALSSAAKFDTFAIQKSATANTGPMTVEVGSTTAALLWQDGSALAANDWPASSIGFIIFDGAIFRYMGAVGPSVFARVGQLPAPAALVHGGSDSSSAGNTVIVNSLNQPVTTVTPFMLFEITKGTAANTGAVTASIAGQSGSVVWADGSVLANGDWPEDTPALLMWDGTVFRILSIMGPSVFARTSSVQPILTGAQTFFVNASTGSDSNNGLSSTSAFSTLQKAVNTIAQFNLNGFNVTVNVANGTYAHVALLPLGGSGSVTFIGNSTTPSSCTISATSGSAVSALTSSGYAFNGFRFQSSGSTPSDAGCGVLVVDCSILLSNVAFGACQGAWASSENGAQVSFSGLLQIFGGTTANSLLNGAGFNAQSGGSISSSFPANVTLTIENTVSVSSFIQASLLGNTLFTPVSITGAGNVTGAKFNVTSNGVVDTNGSGINFYPGNTAGSTVTGGQYI
jgi:hypothetical protein